VLAERLILGASGLLGRALLRKFGTTGTIATGCSRISDGLVKFDALKDDLKPILNQLEAGAPVIFLFGMTKIDECGRKYEESWQINVQATIQHIGSALSAGCKPVFVSTDAVFDGRKGNYTEIDDTRPLHQYARQKLEVEDYLSQIGASHLVLRVPKVVSAVPELGTLFQNWIAALERGKEIWCAEDQIFNPIEVDDFAECVAMLLESGEEGIIHLGGSEKTNRADLYELMVNELGQILPDGQMIRCNINEFSEFLEPRPLNCTLNCERLTMALKSRLKLRSMRDVCAEIGRNLISKKEACLSR